jgi:hypothetical protein
MKNHYIYKAWAFALALSLSLAPLSVAAQEQPQQQGPTPQNSESPTTTEDLGYGVGSVLSSLFYSPLKVTYAGLGLLTGGLGFVLSAGNVDVANNIINPAVRGDYVVTPSHLKGEEMLIFIGPPPGSEPQQPQRAPAAR